MTTAPSYHPRLFPYKQKLIWLREQDGDAAATVYAPGWHPEYSIVGCVSLAMAEDCAKRFIDERDGSALVIVSPASGSTT
jgi:hypothetical protein